MEDLRGVFTHLSTCSSGHFQSRKDLLGLWETLTPIKDGGALPVSHLESGINAGAVRAAAPASFAQWFAVYTSPRHEKRVSELLLERDIETVLPLYKVVREWKKSAPVAIDLPLFPCYLFVSILRSNRLSVLRVPGVVSIVGSPTEPWPLPANEIEALRVGSQEGRIEPHPYLRIGERARIVSGPMSGIEGVLTRRKNQTKLILTLEALMRSVAIEVDAHHLETLENGL